MSILTITKPGTGETVKQGMLATIHYTGWLSDSTKADKKGSKFDSSLDRRQPFTFVIGDKRIIKGFEKIADMNVGAQATLEIPPEEGYGRAVGPILPTSTLIFDIELLEAMPTIREEHNTEGSGRVADAKSAVKAHYSAWLYDYSKPGNKGARFDSSYDRAVPIAFVIGDGKVIKLLEEGVTGMREKGTRRFVIPSSMVDTTRGMARPFPRNAALIFEIDLLEVTQLLNGTS